MKLIIKLLLTFAVIFISVSTWAQGDIITAKEFKELIKSNPDLVIIDVSKPKAFKKSHVKNAINLHHNEMVQKNEDIPGLLLPLDKLAKLFGDKGITKNSAIVVYDGGTQKYSSRVYWALLYAGANNVKIVHKEMNEWRKARIPLTSQVVKHEPVVFTPFVTESVAADMNYVASIAGDPAVVLIDARHHDEFVGRGENAYDSDGHIAGAIHCQYKTLLKKNGAFKSADEIRIELEKRGVTEDKEVIFYCNTGILGAVGFVAVKNILGFANVRVYDGSIYEWENSHPLEK